MESCLDFRKLNDVTVGDSFPIPNVTDILDSLGKSKYFSTTDCANGFWQIPVREENRPKTAFSTEYGHFEYKSMPLVSKDPSSRFLRWRLKLEEYNYQVVYKPGVRNTKQMD